MHPANLKGPERIDQIDSTMNAHNAHGPPFGPPTTPRAPFLLGRTNPCLPQIVPCCQNSFLAVKNRSLLSNIVPCCQNSILAAKPNHKLIQTSEFGIQFRAGHNSFRSPMHLHAGLFATHAHTQLGPPHPGDALFKNPIIHSTRTQ